MLNSFVKRLRSKKIYQDVLAVAFIEANMSWIGADRIANILNRSKYGPMLCDSADPKDQGRVGVWTGDVAKRVYAEDLKRRVNEETLHFAEKNQFLRCFSMKPDENKVGVEPDKQIASFLQQAANFRKETRVPKDVFSSGKEVYTGKRPGQPDDLMLSTQICHSNALRLRNSDKFIEFCAKRGFKP